jgi:hypothetical protein
MPQATFEQLSQIVRSIHVECYPWKARNARLDACRTGQRAVLDKTFLAKREGNRSWRMQQQHIGTLSRAIWRHRHRWHGGSVICALAISHHMSHHRQDVVTSEEWQVTEHNQ